MTIEDRSEADVRRVAGGLKRKIREAGLSYKEVEERAGMGRDYLRQVLRGSVKLRLEHVFTLLDVLGVAPLDFFVEIYAPPSGERPAAAPTPGVDQILSLLQRSFRDLERAFSDLQVKTVTIDKDDTTIKVEGRTGGDGEPAARRRPLR